MGMVLLLLIAVFCSVFVATHAIDRCPGGYTYNGRCFWSGGSRTWDQCQTYCSSQGWRMICVDSAATNSFLLSSLPANQYTAIGLNDKASQNNYAWSGSCSPSGYREWASGQPDGGSTENCVAFGSIGKWHDLVCNGGIACACESTWTFEPTANPTKNPTANPTKDPTRNPTKDPTRNQTANPTCHPTASPTVTPTCVPTSQPSRQPSSQPSRQPSRQPSAQPSHQPSRQPSAQPTARLTMQPSHQPSMQPSAQPASLPSAQPSAQPSSRPSNQPSNQPSALPSAQPSSQPSSSPSTQPSAHPSVQPSAQPSKQPSAQPSSEPSGQPSTQPSALPSAQPSVQPSTQPSSLPSAEPTNQPSMQPSGEPSGQPSAQPTTQPSVQPSGQPSIQPSAQPSSQPSSQPSAEPTSQPSMQPSGEPSGQPSAQPTTQPSVQPSGQPSIQPSAQPSSQPSNQPSGEPTGQPSVHPSSQPSSQPSVQPSSQPSVQPSDQPSVQPSSQPSGEPTAQPTASPSSQPSMQPSTQPSAQPTTQPSGQPSGQPSIQPSCQPSVQPSDQPSTQPTCEPSSQPTVQPTGEPTSQPSKQPSSQPSLQPSHQPSAVPTSQPTCAPSELPTSEWAVTLHHQAPPFKALAAHNGHVWTCSETGQCVLLDVIDGDIVRQFDFESHVHSVLGTATAERVVVSGYTGRSSNSEVEVSDVAQCTVKPTSLFCDVMSFDETHFLAASFVSHVNKLVYIGQYNAFLSATIINTKEGSAETYVYTLYNLRSVVLLHILSPPRYVGSFVAGTAVRRAGASVNYILFGKLRSDYGTLTGVSLFPVNGSILNRAELVNAMALEYEHPDSFIAGALQLSDGAGMHAYVVRVNGLYNSVRYCVRYPVRRSIDGGRRALADSVHAYSSVARSVAVVGDLMFVTVHSPYPSASPTSTTAVTVLQTDAVTGDIQKQVHLAAPSGSFTCSKITYTGVYLTLLCALLQSNANSVVSTAVVISVDTELTFKWLPTGLIRSDVDIFETEHVSFTCSALTITAVKADVIMSIRSFSIYNALSDQPSSSPTAAPSVSPQPTSHPSSSGPTNTKQPTVKPTHRPTVTSPTATPSKGPSLTPTARPSAKRTAVPTRSSRPTRAPTVRHSPVPTTAPPVVPVAASLLVTDLSKNDIVNLILAIVGAVVGFIVLLHGLRKCLQCSGETIEKDYRRMLYMERFDAPTEPYFPVLRAIVGYLLGIDTPNTTRPPLTGSENNDEVTQTTVSVTLMHSGKGAYIKSRADSIDLEANTTQIHNNASAYNAKGEKSIVTLTSSLSQVKDGEAKNRKYIRLMKDTTNFKNASEGRAYSGKSNCSSDSASSIWDNDDRGDSRVTNSMSTNYDYISECSSVVYSISTGNASNDTATVSHSNNNFNSAEGHSSIGEDDSMLTSSSVPSENSDICSNGSIMDASESGSGDVRDGSEGSIDTYGLGSNNSSLHSTSPEDLEGKTSSQGSDNFITNDSGYASEGSGGSSVDYASDITDSSKKTCKGDKNSQ